MARRCVLRDREREIPLLGFCAYSGTGKTTLLRQLLPRLVDNRLRVAVIKHAHHDFEIDYPGKDSYELRHAGASQMLVASHRRLALIEERQTNAEPELDELVARLDLSQVDLVLVEGFKHGTHPKVELHRAALGRPWLFPKDPTIIAVACDEAAPRDRDIPVLSLNEIDAVAAFVLQYATSSNELPRSNLVSG
jgi:molybdopterin-guanine dinucleotide biosynthesis protein MobB